MPANPWPPDTVRTPWWIDGDVVPVGEVLADRRGALRIVALHVAERVVGQHDAPAEGGVGAVALEHGHLVERVAELHRDREVQARRATAQAEQPSSHRSPCPGGRAPPAKCAIAGKIFQARNILVPIRAWLHLDADVTEQLDLASKRQTLTNMFRRQGDGAGDGTRPRRCSGSTRRQAPMTRYHARTHRGRRTRGRTARRNASRVRTRHR